MQIIGTTVLLTGASGGIGRSLAFALEREGAKLILIARDEVKLQALGDQLKADHTIVCCDLNNMKNRADLVQTLINENVTIDLLINNAGISDFSLFESKDENQIEQLLRSNLISPIQLTRELLKLLNNAGATIVNIGSTFGSIGYPGYSTYCASKFGLRGFSESLSRELADTGVNVLYVAPRATRTGINSDAVYDLNQILGNRVDHPDTVASKIVQQIMNDRKSLIIGWPEKLFVKLNNLFSGTVSRVIKTQLVTIKQYAKESSHEAS